MRGGFDWMCHPRECAACGRALCTEEGCSIQAHGDSVEMSDGRWACSGDCWEALADALDGLVSDD